MTVFQKIISEGVLSGDLNTQTPPLISSTAWNNANREVARMIRYYRNDLNRAFSLARKVQDSLESIFPILDDLCQITCPWCPNPCCLVATVWIDFKDLLFLHLRGLYIPSAQLLRNVDNVCSYSTSKGCMLPRISRPWICTWYLCPTQKANFYKKPYAMQTGFHLIVREIKAGRKEMEAEFIRVVS